MWRPNELTYGAWLEHYAAGTIVVKFEALVTGETRDAELRRVLDFLGGAYDAAAVRCAFSRADNRATHRPHTGSLVGADAAWTEGLLAAVWRVVGPRAARLGYTRTNWRKGDADASNATAPVDAANLVG